MFGHNVFGDDLTAKALDMCKKTVLHPYLAFLKAVSPTTHTNTWPRTHIYGHKRTQHAPHLSRLYPLHTHAQIGWRRFHPKRYDLQPPKWLSFVNVVWPVFVCLIIVISCVTQVLSCFRRDSVSGPRPLSQSLFTITVAALVPASHIPSP